MDKFTVFLTILSSVISIIALLGSILSPIITAKINRHYDIEEQKLKFYNTHRAEVIENFISALGAKIEVTDVHMDLDFGKSFGEIYLYTSPELWDDIDNLVNTIDSLSLKEKRLKFSDLCKKLNQHNPRNEYGGKKKNKKG